MNTRVFWMFVAGFALLSLIFFAGLFVGERNFFNSQTNTAVIVGPNQEIKNSLTEINKKPINGYNGGAVVIGEMLFKIVNGQTEVLIQITQAPKQLRYENNVRDIPLQLKISLAKSTDGGSEFEYTDIGILSFDASGANLTAEFSSIIPATFGNFDRIVFRGIKPEDQQTFYILNDPDLPVNVRKQPAPYFWIRI